MDDHNQSPKPQQQDQAANSSNTIPMDSNQTQNTQPQEQAANSSNTNPADYDSGDNTVSRKLHSGELEDVNRPLLSSSSYNKKRDNV